jgi:hypothetical protein
VKKAVEITNSRDLRSHYCGPCVPYAYMFNFALDRSYELQLYMLPCLVIYSKYIAARQAS